MMTTRTQVRAVTINRTVTLGLIDEIIADLGRTSYLLADDDRYDCALELQPTFINGEPFTLRGHIIMAAHGLGDTVTYTPEAEWMLTFGDVLEDQHAAWGAVRTALTYATQPQVVDLRPYDPAYTITRYRP